MLYQWGGGGCIKISRYGKQKREAKMRITTKTKEDNSFEPIKNSKIKVTVLKQILEFKYFIIINMMVKLIIRCF